MFLRYNSKMDTKITAGSKYKRLTALSPLRRGGSWVFQCDCGRTVEKNSYHVLAGKIGSCGCLQNESRSSRALGRGVVDLVGKRFGQLSVIEMSSRKNGRIMWRCKCECGEELDVRGTHLRSGATTTCGCGRASLTIARSTTHGYSNRTEYFIWWSMKARCLNKNHKQYSDYGGRGITICQRWLDSFENFLNDMGDRPGKLTLDRIDNDKGYEPGNCRWATRQEQYANSRPAKMKRQSSSSQTTVLLD